MLGDKRVNNMATKKELFHIVRELRTEQARKSAPSLVAEIMRIAESSVSGRCHEGTIWTWNGPRNTVDFDRFTICRKQFGHRTDTIRWKFDRSIDESTFTRYIES